MKCMVVLSGGLDSYTTLRFALEYYHEVHAVAFDYGQRHRVELDAARRQCEYHDVPLVVLPVQLPTWSADDVEMCGYSDIQGVPNTWVPNRNTVFVSLAASHAMTVDREDKWHVLLGIHAGDSKYPDTTEAWLSKMDDVIAESTSGGVRVMAPYIRSTKVDIVGAGRKMGISKYEYGMTYSCYLGGEKPCGSCATCREREHALGIYYV